MTYERNTEGRPPHFTPLSSGPGATPSVPHLYTFDLQPASFVERNKHEHEHDYTAEVYKHEVTTILPVLEVFCETVLSVKSFFHLSSSLSRFFATQKANLDVVRSAALIRPATYARETTEFF